MTKIKIVFDNEYAKKSHMNCKRDIYPDEKKGTEREKNSAKDVLTYLYSISLTIATTAAILGYLLLLYHIFCT